MLNRRKLFAASLAAVGTAVGQRTWADSWPARPIHLIVPLPPGGSIDYFARAVGEPLARRLGQPIVVENRPGADGRLGMSQLARQPADGYSIGIVSITNVIHPALFKSMAYDIKRDFEPLGMIAESPMVLVVGSAGANLRSVGDLIDLARKAPGQVTYGSSGIGSPFHLSAELLCSVTGVQMLHVPFRGSTQLIQALIGGDVVAAIVPVGPYLPHIRSGRMKALATTLPEGRLSLLPGVPTLNEVLGTDQLSFSGWVGLVAPAGTPQPIVAKFSQELLAVLSDTQFVREKIEAQAYRPLPSTPVQMAEVLRNDLVKYAKAVRDANISAE